MLRKLVQLLLIFATATVVFAESAYNLPHLATGTFSQGSIRTTFLVFNNSDLASVVRISLKDNAGAPLPVTIPGLGTDSQFTFELAAGQTRFLQTDGAGTLKEGSAIVRASQRVGVSAIFSIYDRNGGFLTESGIAASEALNQAGLAVDISSTSNTGVALQNLQSEPVTVTFNVFRSDGTLQAGPVTRDLSADGHLGVFVGGPGGLFPSLVNFRGLLVLDSPQQIAALTLRQNSVPLSFTTLPVTPRGSTRSSYMLPQVANGGGIIKTTFVLFGLGTEALVSIWIVDDDGAPYPVTLRDGQTGSQFSFNLPANGVVFAETNAAGPIKAGAARIVSTAPIGAAGIFTILNRQGGFATETGVAGALDLEEFTLPVDMTGTFDTGLALYNNSDNQADVQLSFVEAGQSGLEAPTAVETFEFSMNGGTHTARFASEFFARGRRGMLSVKTSSPVSALTLRQNTSPLSFTTLPVERGVYGSGGNPPAGSAVLPRTVTGVTLTSNVTLDQTLPPGFTISGTASLPAPAGIPGSFLTAALAESAGGAVYYGSADFDNSYRIVVPGGTYTVRFCYTVLDLTSGASLLAGHDVPNVVVNADVVRNVSVSPVTRRTISGRITNLSSLPEVFGTMLPVLSFVMENGTAGGFFPLLSPDGSYSIRLLDGSYRVSLQFVPGDFEAAGVGEEENARTYALFDIGRLNVTGNASGRNFSVPSVSKLSGQLNRAQGGALPLHTRTEAMDMTAPAVSGVCGVDPVLSLDEADPQRNYELYLTRNRMHDVVASIPATSVGTAKEGTLTVPGRGRSPQTLSGDAVLNFTFPVFPPQVTLSGRVTNAAGQPLAGVVVYATSERLTGLAEGISFTASDVTAPDGRYSLPVLGGSAYRVDFEPDLMLP